MRQRRTPALLVLALCGVARSYVLPGGRAAARLVRTSMQTGGDPDVEPLAATPKSPLPSPAAADAMTMGDNLKFAGSILVYGPFFYGIAFLLQQLTGASS